MTKMEGVGIGVLEVVGLGYGVGVEVVTGLGIAGQLQNRAVIEMASIDTLKKMLVFMAAVYLFQFTA
jgi:hypothetical protein